MKKIFCLLFLLLFVRHLSATELTISAAASLRNVFEALIADYATSAPQTKIHLNTAGSGTLLQQIYHGAPVDILATADIQTMQEAKNKGLLAQNHFAIFATNDLVLAIPKNKTMRIGTLNDLRQATIQRIALGNPKSVPAGRYAEHALRQAHLWQDLADKIIRTRDVRQSLDYIARNEVDVGFVYRTDAMLMEKSVDIVPIRLPEKVSYPIAIINHSQQAEESSRFINFIRSAQGIAILKKYGFRQPEE